MKTRTFAPLALGIAAALALAGCAASDAPKAPTEDAMMTDSASAMAKPLPGDVMNQPEKADPADPRLNFTVATLKGESFTGSSLAGHDSILWFWASWCPTCQSEAPDVAAAAAQLPEGVTLYGVPGKSDQAGMEKFVKDYGLADLTQIVDPDGGLWSTFGVPAQPAFVLINDNGDITTIQGGLGKQGVLDAAADLASS